MLCVGDFFFFFNLVLRRGRTNSAAFSLSMLYLSEVNVTLAELRFWFISELSSVEKSKIRLRILLEALF